MVTAAGGFPFFSAGSEKPASLSQINTISRSSDYQRPARMDDVRVWIYQRAGQFSTDITANQ